METLNRAVLVSFIVLALCWIGREVHWAKTGSGESQATSSPDTLFVLLPYQSDSLNVNQVYQEIKEAGILFPELVLRQAIMETGWFKCQSCSLDSNNLFGFRRDTAYLGFETWQQSVWFYRDWQKRYYPGNGSYYEFLDTCGCFAEDSGYTDQLRQIMLKK